MANLFPGELDLAAITAQVEQLAQLLSEVAAERYVPSHLSPVIAEWPILYVQLRPYITRNARQPKTQSRSYDWNDDTAACERAIAGCYAVGWPHGTATVFSGRKCRGSSTVHDGRTRILVAKRPPRGHVQPLIHPTVVAGRREYLPVDSAAR